MIFFIQNVFLENLNFLKTKGFLQSGHCYKVKSFNLKYFFFSGHLNLTIGFEKCYDFFLEDEDVDFINQFSIMEKIKLRTEINFFWIDDTNIVFWILSTIYPKSLCGLVG